MYHVPIYGGCRVCGYSFDTITHSLFFCLKVKHIWKTLRAWLLLKMIEHGPTNDHCMWMQQNLSCKEFENFATLAWALWKEKLRICHSDERAGVAQNVDYSNDFLLVFKNSKKARQVQHEKAILAYGTIWKKPQQGNWRLDVDACVNLGKGLFSVGGIIPNYQGEIFLVFGKPIPQPQSITEGEMMDVKEGFKIAVEKNIKPLLVTSDSTLAVQTIMKPSENLNYLCFWATKIQHLKNSLSEVTIQHIKCFCKFYLFFLFCLLLFGMMGYLLYSCKIL